MSTSASPGAAAPKSLAEVFRSVPDPRKRRGTRYPAEGLLTLMAVAVLSGADGWTRVAEFAANRPSLARLLGLERERGGKRSRSSPGPNQLMYFFRAVDRAAVEAAVTAWILSRSGGDLPEAVLDIDGKVLRGGRDGSAPGMKLLAAYGRSLGSPLAQAVVAGDEGELQAALRALKVLPLQGAVVVGDAAFCQKELCTAVTQAGGDYVLMVRGNQPELRDDLAAAFGPADSPSGGAVAANRG